MKYRVLVIDDDPSWRGELTRRLEESGLGVSSFSEGDELIRAVKDDEADDYKAVVVDLILDNQRLQGPALCGELKRVKPYLPIFAVTASSDPREIADAMLRSGFDGFIAKASLGQNLKEYVGHIRYVIEINEQYPELPELWKDIASLRDQKYKYVVKAKLIQNLHNTLKKSYFYLMLPEAMPLLPLILSAAKGPYSEAIVQSAIAIEIIINFEDRKWRKEIADDKHVLWLKETHSRREKKMRLMVNRGLWPQGADDEISENIMKVRNKCAHQAYEADKRQAIDVLRRAVGLVKHYLEKKLERDS